MKRRKIIIDTDPGVDDAFAIALALKCKEFDVIGITSSKGNKTLDITTDNAVKLVKYFNGNCKVYRGEEKYITLTSNAVTVDVHGDDGLGGYSTLLEYDENYLSNTPAVDFILSSIKENPGEIEIIALSPLTNIASAILKDESTMKNLKAIYSMGGGIKRGNITKYAEFNYWIDPKALDITYSSIGEHVNIYMFGLDATHSTVLSCNDLYFIKKTGGEQGKLLVKLSEAYLKAYWNFNRYIGCVLHDLLVVAYMVDNSICPSIRRARLTTEVDGEKQGITVCDFNSNIPNVFVVASVDAFKYKTTFIERMFGKEICEEYKNSIKAINDCNHGYKVKEII